MRPRRRSLPSRSGSRPSAAHGLFLPILLHCVDDHGRPLLGPPKKSTETGAFLHDAHTDIQPW